VLLPEPSWIGELGRAMADSDDEYISDASDLPAPTAAGVRAHATRSTGPVPSAAPKIDKGGGHKRAAWEDIQRSWDTVVEGADGNLTTSVEELKEAGKRQR